MQQRVYECHMNSVDGWSSLQQNVIDAAINEWRKQLRACVRADGQHFEHLLWAYVTNKSYGQIKYKSLKRCSFTAELVICRGLKVSQGKVSTINRWGGISNDLLMAYLVSNICTENYCNRATIVEIIVGGCVVSLSETQCMYLSKQINICSNKELICLNK